VARHGRLLRLLMWGEIALLLAAVVGPLWWLAVAPAPWKWAWAAALWVFAAIAFVFAVINRRGTWSSADRGLAAQLDLTELRCRRLRRTLRAVPIMFAAESAVTLLIIGHFGRGSVVTAGALLAAIAVPTAIWWAMLDVRTRRRMAQVAAIRRELAERADEA
jgi:hypothetical protein